ncbi:MAG: phytoene/squalene synthase family protein [Bryobacteraceae bacterium]
MSSLGAPGDQGAIREITRAARTVLRAYSSSFFLVTRFLPAHKRASVDLIYAAVRYPDEIVDTFAAGSEAKLQMLGRWERHYYQALTLGSIRERLRTGVPWILSGFAEVVRQSGIPADHYGDFLDAMRRDIAPKPFRDLEDLVENYIYGSAIVVGYFLAHVYGTAEGVSMAEAYRCAAELGVALQLTNFARDVAEDRRRGRLYIPSEIIESRGTREGVRFLAETAEARYETASRSLHVFAADTRPAIRACIDVYRLLNRRILHSGDAEVRHSVPIAQKLSALPTGKYWRVPLAYLGGL